MVVADHEKLGLALINRSLIFIFAYINSEVDERLSHFCQTTWSHRVCKAFSLSLSKKSREKRFYNFIKKFFIVVPLQYKTLFCFKDSLVEVVGKVKLVHMQSIRVVSLMIVDLHFNIGHNWVQNCIQLSNERNWSLLLFLCFLIHFCIFLALFLVFSGIVYFVTTTNKKFQFQSEARQSQIKK